MTKIYTTPHSVLLLLFGYPKYCVLFGGYIVSTYIL